MTDTTLSSPVATRRFGLDRLLPATLLAAGVTAVANLVVFAVARGLFDVSFMMPLSGSNEPLERLPIAMVVTMSVIPAVVAGVLLWVLVRFVRRPLRVFLVIGLVVFVVSFGPVLALEDTNTATRLALSAMHVVAAVTILGPLTASVRWTGTRMVP